MTNEVRQAKNAYMREWRKNNKDKTKQYNASYWERRIAKEKDDKKKS